MEHVWWPLHSAQHSTALPHRNHQPCSHTETISHAASTYSNGLYFNEHFAEIACAHFLVCACLLHLVHNVVQLLRTPQASCNKCAGTSVQPSIGAFIFSSLVMLSPYERPIVKDEHAQHMTCAPCKCLQVVLEEGFLICPESQRRFPVSKGIPNLLLNEDEC